VRGAGGSVQPAVWQRSALAAIKGCMSPRRQGEPNLTLAALSFRPEASGSVSMRHDACYGRNACSLGVAKAGTRLSKTPAPARQGHAVYHRMESRMPSGRVQPVASGIDDTHGSAESTADRVPLTPPQPGLLRPSATSTAIG
jgi:hypothetical protein